MEKAVKYDAPDYVTENEIAGELEISYYKRKVATGQDWFLGFGLWFGVTFISIFPAVFIVFENTGQWLYTFIFVGVASVLSLYFGFIWLFIKVTYIISHDQIVRTKKAPLWNTRKSINPETILEFNECYISMESGDFRPSDDTDLCKYLVWRMAKYYGK